MPSDLMNSFMGTDCTAILEVSTESQKSDDVEAALTQVVNNNPGLSIYTFQESLNYYTYQQQFMNASSDLIY